MNKLLLFLLLSFIICLPAQATKVISVIDGDTIVTNEGKIRLSYIDAPELKQPFGDISKQALNNLLWGQEITLIRHGKDRYGRILAEVVPPWLTEDMKESLGDDNINEFLVDWGYAWSYRNQNKKYNILQERARVLKLGLWKDKKPIPPWEFRKKKWKF